MLCHWFNWSILACHCFVSVSLLFFISGGEFTSFVCEAGESKNVFFLLVEVLLLLDFYWLLFLSLFGLVVVMVCCVHDTHLVNTHTGPQNFPETGSRSLPAALWEAFRKSFSFVRDYTFPPLPFFQVQAYPRSGDAQANSLLQMWFWQSFPPHRGLLYHCQMFNWNMELQYI